MKYISFLERLNSSLSYSCSHHAHTSHVIVISEKLDIYFVFAYTPSYSLLDDLTHNIHIVAVGFF